MPEMHMFVIDSIQQCQQCSMQSLTISYHNVGYSLPAVTMHVQQYMHKCLGQGMSSDCVTITVAGSQ